MEKQRIHSNDAPAAVGPYSQAVRVGDFLFTAGQVASAFKAVDADHIDALVHRRYRVAYAGAFVDHLDAIFLEARQVVGRCAAAPTANSRARSSDRAAPRAVARVRSPRARSGAIW